MRGVDDRGAPNKPRNGDVMESHYIMREVTSLGYKTARMRSKYYSYLMYSVRIPNLPDSS